MFIYLNSCSEKFLAWISLYKSVLMNSSTKEILTTLNQIMIKTAYEKLYYQAASDTIEKVLFHFENKSNSLKAQSKREIYKVRNHPVHMVDNDNLALPSSFIPFCEFGGNMSAMGTKIDLMDVPVCSSFKENIKKCY